MQFVATETTQGVSAARTGSNETSVMIRADLTGARELDFFLSLMQKVAYLKWILFQNRTTHLGKKNKIK